MEMTDQSGFQQSPENIRVPTPREIAIVLGRICRYAGNVPCSVLTHVFVGAPLVWDKARHLSEDRKKATMSWWFLHDAHEAITGDFAVCKPNRVEEWQWLIDLAIFKEYGIDFENIDFVIIKGVDLLTRYLEAEYLGGNVFFETFKQYHEYAVPTAGQRRLTLGVFHNGNGNAYLSKTFVDTNDEEAELPHFVDMYKTILSLLLEGNLDKALELYSGMIMDLGLDT
jgi:hypothetical protein